MRSCSSCACLVLEGMTIIMSNFFKVVSFLVVAACVSGCGTLAGRVADYKSVSDAEYYKSTHSDGLLLGFDGGTGLMIPCYLSIACPFLVIASIPIDLAVDTLLLPYDYVRAAKRKGMTYEQVRKEVEYGSIVMDFRASRNVGERRTIDYWMMYACIGASELTYLDVFSMPVDEGVAIAYIPVIKRCQPFSLSAYYSSVSGYGLLKFRFQGETVSFIDPKENAEANSRQYQSGTTFVFFDDEKRSENTGSKVSITPWIKKKSSP